MIVLGFLLLVSDSVATLAPCVKLWSVKFHFRLSVDSVCSDLIFDSVCALSAWHRVKL